MNNTPALLDKVKLTEITKQYVSGFIDGEGSFLVSFSIRENISLGVEARPSFTVSQHKRSLIVLKELKKFFDCGTIRFNKSDDTYKYEVRSLHDLVQKITPHFIGNPLRTSKWKDFEIFRKICVLMKTKQHRTANGLKKIILLAYRMNNLGSRKHQKTVLLKVLKKMKV